MAKIEKIGARITQLRERAEISQSDLARAIGITPQAVQKWEAGQSDPRFSKLPDIAAALNTSLVELLRHTRFEIAAEDLVKVIERPSENQARRIRDVLTQHGLTEAPLSLRDQLTLAVRKGRAPETRESVEHQGIRTGKLPLISWVQAGDWSEIVNNLHPGDAEDWIPVPFKHGPDAFCLRVVGDSMFDPGGDKSYASGDYIAVDPSRDPVNRSMVVVRMIDDDKATFKQLIVDPDGTKMLKALNPNWPKRYIEINGNAKIVGVVIGKWVPE